MSAHVTNILTALNLQAATTLGVTYKQLAYVYDVTMNNTRAGYQAFGWRPLDALPSDTVTRMYCLDHRFELILCNSMGRRSDDGEITDSLGTMYDKTDELFKALVHTKLSLPAIILDVRAPSLSAPEVYERKNLVVLRMQVSIKYRSALT